MADDVTEPSNPEQKRAEISFSIIDTWKVKAPSVIPMLPPEFYPIMGRVAHAWGVFETIFDHFMAALVKASDTPGRGWKGLSFRKKRALFLAEIGSAFDDLPSVTAYLKIVLADIEPLYIKRNLVVHGQHGVRIGPGVPTVLVTNGRYRGQEITDRFTADQLDDLYYEICHLAGRLNLVSQGNTYPPLPLPHKSKLQTFLASNHPTYPTGYMPQPQP